MEEDVGFGLNAPFGARCFLTHDSQERDVLGLLDLMHLLVLGAF